MTDDRSTPSEHHEEPATDAAESGNRGKRAPDEGSGAVTGSGAAAGGGGGPEEYDSDPMAGGGSFKMRKQDAAPDKGGDAPIHGSH